MKMHKGTVGVVMSFAVALTACGGGADPGSQDSADQVYVVWASTGGSFTEAEAVAIQEPYSENTGVLFNQVSPVSQEQIRAMVDADNVVWDMVSARWHFAEIYCDELYEPLDKELFADVPFPENTTSDCFVPTGLVARIFSYNADVYADEAPTTIADFFDTERFPGKRVITDQPDGLLEAALVADGVAPADVYPLDYERAFAKLDTIKDDLIIAPSFGALQEFLVGGQADMTITVTARSAAVRDSGTNLVPVWDLTTGSITSQYIVKGAPNAEVAQDVIRFSMEPEQQIAYAEATGLSPARTDIDSSQINFTETQHMFNAFAPDAERGDVIFQDIAWFAEHADEVQERWTEWTLG